MNGANPCAGQHGDGRFHDHGQIDANPVALFHAKLPHGISQFADARMQFAVGHLGIRRRVIAFPQDRHLITARRQMPIEAGD